MTPAERDVFLIEDDRDLRETLSWVLEDAGYHVRSAANGRDALQQLRAGPLPAIILLDLMMPVMDGWQFRAEQQEDSRLSPIPLVVLTAAGNAQEKTASIHPAAVVNKPVPLDRLIGTIETVLGGAA